MVISSTEGLDLDYAEKWLNTFLPVIWRKQKKPKTQQPWTSILTKSPTA